MSVQLSQLLLARRGQPTERGRSRKRQREREFIHPFSPSPSEAATTSRNFPALPPPPSSRSSAFTSQITSEPFRMPAIFPNCISRNKHPARVSRIREVVVQAWTKRVRNDSLSDGNECTRNRELVVFTQK